MSVVRLQEWHPVCKKMYFVLNLCRFSWTSLWFGEIQSISWRTEKSDQWNKKL